MVLATTIVVTIFQLAYAIATIVYVRELHHAPAHTPCSQVLPGVRDFLRIGGWITLVMVVGWLGFWLVSVNGWHVIARVGHPAETVSTVINWLMLMVTVVYSVAVPILSIQYTNTLRNATTDTTRVAECIQIAPYTRTTMVSTAWMNLATIVGMGVFLGGWVPSAKDLFR